MTDFSFPKSQRLTGETRIERLFMQGKSFMAYPLRVVYLADNENNPPHPQIVISVAKKRFKRANKRNLLKRRIREAYRLNHKDLFQAISLKDYSLHIGISYIANEILPYELIEKKMREALSKLAACNE